jgi:hypothetical protein
MVHAACGCDHCGYGVLWDERHFARYAGRVPMAPEEALAFIRADGGCDCGEPYTLDSYIRWSEGGEDDAPPIVEWTRAA